MNLTEFALIYTYTLTDDVKRDKVAHLELRAHLAFVLTGISGLHIFYLQRPSIGRLDQKRLEPFVRDEREPIHGQNMGIAAPDPRNLPAFGAKKNKKKITISSLHRTQIKFETFSRFRKNK